MEQIPPRRDVRTKTSNVDNKQQTTQDRALDTMLQTGSSGKKAS